MSQLMTLTPNVKHVWNPWDSRQTVSSNSGVGLTLRELAPKTDRQVLCSVNGVYYVQADWDFVEVLPVTDRVIFTVLPKGNGGAGGSIMAIIGVVLIAYGAWTGNTQLVAIGVGLLAGGLIPLPNVKSPISQGVESPSSTYNLQFSGNSARLGQALPVPYGRHLISPDFASQPYSVFGENDVQYYYCILSFGMMTHYRVASLMIGNTPVEQFEEVTTQYVGAGSGNVPGVGAINTLSLVHPVVVSAPEVANQELFNTEYVGPFIVCGQGLQTTKIGFDVICPNGLYYGEDSGTLSNKSFTVMFEARKVNATTGAPIGSWTLLGVETVTRAQNSPVRVSFEYTVTAARWQVRASRQDVKDQSSRVAHTVQWSGLKAYLTVSAPFDVAGNYLAMKAKATNQLSGLSERKVNVIVERWLPWHDGVSWQAPQYTQAIAWAAADIARNTEYGLGMSDSRIDLESLLALHEVWEARGDTFNAIFDQRVTAWSALETVLRCGRARPIMRGAILTFVRDQSQELPSAVFSQHVNVQRDSFSAKYTLVTDDDVDGVEIEYFDSSTWSTQYVRKPVPGGPAESLIPKTVQIQGIDNVYQATRECLFYAACMAYRRSVVQFTTEMEGYLPPFGDTVGVVHDVFAVGSSGVVEDWDGLTATGTEDVNWSVGQNYCVLRGPDGDLHGPYLVSQGPAPRQFTFTYLPDIVPYTGVERERTIYAIGPASAWAKMIKLLSITPAAGDTVSMVGVIDDPRVHTADESVTTPGGGGGSGGAGCVYMADGHPTYGASSEAQRHPGGFYAGDDYFVDGDPPYNYQ